MKKLDVSLLEAFPEPQARLVDVKIPYAVWSQMKHKDRKRPTQRLMYQRSSHDRP